MSFEKRIVTLNLQKDLRLFQNKRELQQKLHHLAEKEFLEKDNS